MDVNRVYSGGFSPDESKIILGSDESGIFNLYELNLSTDEKKQLTSSADNAVFSNKALPIPQSLSSSAS